MKNLANCTPTEFLKQGYRIKNSAEKWVKETKILEIRKNLPNLIDTTKLKGDELIDAQKKNRESVKKQVMQNMLDMLDSMMDKNAKDTLELLALCCFVEPEDVDNHTMSEYLSSLAEMLTDKGVVSFFTSLAQLGQMNF